MSTPSSSTSQLVSSSSTTSSVPQKDFSSSFGQLQSTYGLSGSVPTPVSSQSQLPVKSSRPKKSSRFFGSSPSGQNVQSTSPPKDFESSFGQLQSQYGFGGPFSMTKFGPKK
ncbi:hypothetical protein BD410DRAFT_791799 [Rickenella mellea]|uniref:Uncharacterized protein n=1 Tax=Rickenella mellea TaxID=50990 RepID=A0A4Y7PW96_9AGAM|nr:hypothetical protein BD410DRAFT_791799 [Rickenella mellea]